MADTFFARCSRWNLGRRVDEFRRRRIEKKIISNIESEFLYSVLNICTKYGGHPEINFITIIIAIWRLKVRRLVSSHPVHRLMHTKECSFVSFINSLTPQRGIFSVLFDKNENTKTTINLTFWMRGVCAILSIKLLIDHWFEHWIRDTCLCVCNAGWKQKMPSADRGISNKGIVVHLSQSIEAFFSAYLAIHSLSTTTKRRFDGDGLSTAAPHNSRQWGLHSIFVDIVFVSTQWTYRAPQ